MSNSDMELEKNFYALKSEYNYLNTTKKNLDILLENNKYLKGLQFISLNNVEEQHKHFKFVDNVNEFYKPLNDECTKEMLTNLPKQQLIILHELFIKNDLSILDNLDIWNSKFLVLVGFYLFLQKDIEKAKYYIRLATNINVNENLYLGKLFIYLEDYTNTIKYLKLAKRYRNRNSFGTHSTYYDYIITVYKLLQICFIQLGKTDRWYKCAENAAILGCAQSQSCISIFYFCGFGFIFNISYDVAENYWLLACKNGFVHDNDHLLQTITKESEKYKKFRRLYVLHAKKINNLVESDLQLLLKEYTNLQNLVYKKKLKVDSLAYIPGGLGYEFCKQRFNGKYKNSQ